MTTQPPRVSATARSPLSGCTILILAVLMLVFLIGFSIWTPFRQAAEIEKFTKAEPEPLAVLSLEAEEIPARDFATLPLADKYQIYVFDGFLALFFDVVNGLQIGWI